MLFSLKHPLILGSSSPRRREILSMLGIAHSVEKPDVDEDYDPVNFSTPAQITMYLAQKKAVSIVSPKDHLVLGVDTLVAVDNTVLGKPAHRDEAFNFLKQLNGRSHTVYTGICLCQNQNTVHLAVDTSTVVFRQWPDEILWRYVDSGEPMDKAGAYGIQGLGAFLVDHIEGCFFNVMGLPVAKTLASLEPFLH